MTAYSRLTHMTKWGLLTIELQSLNRKHLEINSSVPKEFLFLDPLIKKQIQKRLFRGKVNIYLSFSFNEEAKALKLTANLPLAKEIKEGWNAVSNHLEIQDKEKGLLRLLTRESNLFQSEFDSSFLDALKKEIIDLLDQGLNDLVKMRDQEGLFLKKELESQVEKLSNLLEKGKAFVKDASKERQKKLKERISDLLETPVDSDDRMLKEIAFLADKCDLTEEVTRIASHLELFKEKLSEEKKSVGKTLDFITQELNREWNTIGSKCFDTETSHLVIEAKGECEKIREQVQNIE